MVWVWGIVKLFNIYLAPFYFNESSFVVVNSAIVGSGENGNNLGEIGAKVEHFEAFKVNFMGSDDSLEVVSLQKLLYSLLSIKIGTSPGIVVRKVAVLGGGV